MPPNIGLGTIQSFLFGTAALATIPANYGRIQLEAEVELHTYYIAFEWKLISEITANLETSGFPKHEAKDNWLGYQANAWTALYGFRQGYFYYSAMGIFYYHLATRKGKLHWLELAGIANQVVFHVHSIFEFRGLSQQVSAIFAALVGGGAVANYTANLE